MDRSSAISQGSCRALSLPPEAFVNESAANPDVMLIDDEADVLDVIEQVANMIDLTVVSFIDPNEALKQFPDLLPKMVMIDNQLGRTSGLDLARQIKAIPGTEDCILILISGMVQECVRTQADEIGFQYTLEKPVPINRLVEIFTSLEH